MTAYTQSADAVVSARQRTAVYLEPRDNLYFNASGRAVAVYDYDLQMRRVAAPRGATACVQTPKDVVQCI